MAEGAVSEVEVAAVEEVTWVVEGAVADQMPLQVRNQLLLTH